ncbi:MAG: DUF2490 domain-containing protein [Lentisphaerae bacterium]|nr:DUF2490 domain-containing protein [Lentisphaerota bacterium]
MRSSLTRRAATAALAALALGCATGRAYDDGDGQVWINFSAGGKLAKDLTAKLEEESRIGNDAREYYEQHLSAMAEYPLADWCRVGLGLREVFARVNQTVYAAKTADDVTTYTALKTDGHYWKRENRPTAEVTVRKTAARWGLEDRVRVEYRMKQGEDDYFRYRNRVKVKAPWKWTRLAIGPYAAWETNYSDKPVAPALDRSRYYAGVDAKLTETAKGGLYYCLQQDKGAGGWTDVHIAGVTVSLGL